jgi:pyruvate-ferredoxin/flavodoxin oxidoreductase
MLQSKAGIVNKEYQAQKALLADVDSGKIKLEDFLPHADEMLREKLGTLTPAKA